MNSYIFLIISGVIYHREVRRFVSFFLNTVMGTQKANFSGQMREIFLSVLTSKWISSLSHKLKCYNNENSLLQRALWIN